MHYNKQLGSTVRKEKGQKTETMYGILLTYMYIQNWLKHEELLQVSYWLCITIRLAAFAILRVFKIEISNSKI